MAKARRGLFDMYIMIKSRRRQISEELIKRKQRTDEPIDKYAQSFEMLFDKSYGN